jgi:hypothetical protein
MFVSCVIVDDQVNSEFGRDTVVPSPQKSEKLLVPVSWLAFGEHGASGDVERGTQSSCPVAEVIVGDSVDITEPHGQDWLSTVQGLDLAFFIHAEHEHMIGRGFRYSPAILRTFSIKKGSVERLKVRERWG